MANANTQAVLTTRITMTRFFSIPIASPSACSAAISRRRPEVPDVVVAAATPAVATPPAVTPPPVTQPVAVQPKKEEPPAQTAFPFPTDAAGKLLPAVVTPNSPIPPPIEKFGKAPKVRIVPGKLIEPDPLSKMTYVPTPLSSAKPAGSRLPRPRPNACRSISASGQLQFPRSRPSQKRRASRSRPAMWRCHRI